MKQKDIWGPKHWEDLFILLKREFLSNYYTYHDFDEYIKQNKNAPIINKLVYNLLELLDEFNLYDIDLSDY